MLRSPTVRVEKNKCLIYRFTYLQMYGFIYRFGRFDGFIYRFILFCINWILVRMLVRDFVFTIIRNENPNENIKKMADKLPKKIFLHRLVGTFFENLRNLYS